ncbi:MAG: hypothetical protein ACI9ZF_002770, partial [Bradyrhizobium sp.]
PHDKKRCRIREATGGKETAGLSRPVPVTVR